MNPFILAAVLLFCPFSLLAGGANPAAQQLFTGALQQSSLRHDGAGAFQLDADFFAQIQIPMRGHYTLKWEDKDHWWRKIVMSEFQQIDVRKGEWLYTARNAHFTPIRIKELIGLLQYADYSEEWQVTKEKQHAEDGLEESCLQVKSQSGRGATHEICVNPATREILSDEWKDAAEESRREQFRDYFDFRGQRYPRKLELLENKINAVTAQVTDLRATALDPALLAPPPGAIERRQCPGLKHPVPLKTPDPAYPPSARQNGFMGDTTVSMTVLTDGSVTDIQLVGSATHSMDEATLQTLKSWRFKPAMCGTEPVVSDVEVIVSFRLH